MENTLHRVQDLADQATSITITSGEHTTGAKDTTMAKRQPDLRKLAKRQRWMVWLALLALLSQFLPSLTLNYLGGRPQFFLMIGAFLLFIAVYFLMIVGTVLVLHAQGNHIVMIIVCAIVMFAPCGNFLLLLLVNMSATRSLRRAGIRVGFMGADLTQVERIVNPDLCNTCGYNLTGNVSGICPECGRSIDQLMPHPGGELLDTT